MRTFSKTSGIIAASALFFATTAIAQTAGFTPTDSGTTVNGGVITLDSRGQSDGTSLENQNVNIAVKNGDTISFEYKGPCGGGAPRIFIQGGAFNTFDQDPNGSACGTDTDGDGFFTVTQTISGITAGTAGYVGIVNDNIANPSVVMIRNVTIAGVSIFAPATADQCKNGGFKAGGFRNQGECVSSFRSNRPDNR
jgi:hypothetical protein